MAKFIHKPYQIEATQWFAAGDHPAVVGRTPPDGNAENTIHVLPTDFGDREIKSGDWIATDANGNHHIFSNEYMQSNYDVFAESESLRSVTPVMPEIPSINPDNSVSLGGEIEPAAIQNQNPLFGLENFPGI